MRSREDVETVALELLEDWRNGNRGDFRVKVSELEPLEAMYCGLIILDYMQSDEDDGQLEQALFADQVYTD